MKMRLGHQVYVAWKPRKMLHDVIGGHQAYIHEKNGLWRIEFCSWLRPPAVSRLRARRDYKVATLSALRAELRLELCHGVAQPNIIKIYISKRIK